MQAADQLPEGTFSDQCITLAGMASTAVDYSKTGIAVDMNLFPRGFDRRAKPDFMGYAPRLVVAADQLQLVENDPLEHEEFDAVHALDLDKRRPMYYISEKTLGKLYRAIDETKFMSDMNTRLHQINQVTSPRTFMQNVWDHVQRNVKYIQRRYLRSEALQIRETYEHGILDTINQFSPHPREPLSELEVFAGTILGRMGGNPNKRTRELAISMKTHFDSFVTYIIGWIQHGADAQDDETEEYGQQNEALERSIACLAVAMEEEGKPVRCGGKLQSFAYVAAAVCLKEVAELAALRR